MQQESPIIDLPPKPQLGVLWGAALLWFFNLLYVFTMPVVLPRLMQNYGIAAHYAALGWLTSIIYVLFVPVGSRLGDRLGRRRVVLAAGWLRLAIILAVAIPTNGVLFLILYSLGNCMAGLTNALPTTIVSEVTIPQDRPRWFGILGTLNGAALLLGLFGGGLVVDHMGSLAVFVFFLPLGLVSLVLLSRYYPNRPAGEGRAPLLSFALFKKREFSLSFATHMLIAPMMSLCSTVLALYGQLGLGLSAAATGALALPKNILFLILPPFLGAWIGGKRERYRLIFLLCGGSIALASILASTWTTATAMIIIYGVMFLFGLGTSCQTVVVQPYMQTAIEPEHLGVANAMVLLANSVGLVFFNAFFNVLYNGRYEAAMAAGGGPSLARAMVEVFSKVARLSALAGLLIMAFTFWLTSPQAQEQRLAA